MISRLHLKFQSHIDTFLDLSEGVNVIIGSSDSGKSAIIRAFEWVRTNRPLGDSYIPNNSDEAKVEIGIDGSDGCGRFKSRKANSYYTGKDKLTGFGQSVPEEVTELLNMDETNIQLQMDQPFLLSESATEVGRVINQACNIEVIDSSLSNCVKDLRKISRDEKYISESIEESQEQLKEFDYIDIVEEAVVEIEGLVKEVAQVKAKKDLIEKFLGKLDILTKKADRHEVPKNLSNIIDKAIDANTKLLSIKKSISRLSILENELEEIKKLNPLENIIEELIETIELKDTLEASLDSVREQNEALGYIEANIKELTQEIANNMPETCPLCGGRNDN